MSGSNPEQKPDMTFQESDRVPADTVDELNPNGGDRSPKPYRKTFDRQEGKSTSAQPEFQSPEPKIPKLRNRGRKKQASSEPEYAEIYDLDGQKIRTTREIQMLIGLSMFFGERFYPLDELGWTFRVQNSDGELIAMDPQYLRHSLLRVEEVEGRGFSTSMKWWKITSMVTSSLALLSSVAIGISWVAGNHVLSGSWLVHPALIPIWLAVAFSLGGLDRRLVSFGWPRWRRLLSLRGSRNQSVKDWLGESRSRGDYEDVTESRSKRR